MKPRKLLQGAFSTALLLISSTGFGAPVVLLNENFNGVTGLPMPDDVRSVKNILDNNPGQLPAGTTFSAFFSPGDINVRRADNTINTTVGMNGFDSFFTPVNGTNNFLVLGDAGGIIGGPPTLGTTQVNFPFTLPVGATSIIVSFDYAFDGTDTNGSLQPNDVFHVELQGAAHTFLNLPSPIFQSQPFTSTITGLTGGQRLSLSFVLDETDAPAVTTISAAGIDNIHVSAVPEPAPALLLALGLATLGISRWNQRKLNKRGKEDAVSFSV